MTLCDLPLKPCISEALFHVWTWAACLPSPTALQWSGMGTAPDLLSHYRIAVFGWHPAPGPRKSHHCLLSAAFTFISGCFAAPLVPGDSSSMPRRGAGCTWGFCFLLSSQRGAGLSNENSQTLIEEALL